jgi:hypothetical protein
MGVFHIAIINQSDNLSPEDIEKATAAVQKQVTVDFTPVWDITAVVSAFSSLASMPNGYWPVVIRDEIGINQPGAHVSGDGQKPFALVLFTGHKWTITLSHEVLELLVDPFGTTRRTGPSPRDGEGDVEFLAEICDPCQSNECAYLVNGDQFVSDFVFPSYYNGFGMGKYSQMGSVTSPREVLSQGYVTWHNLAKDEWWQAFDNGSGTQFRQLDPDLLQADIHLRGAVDRDTVALLARRKKAIRNPLLARMHRRNELRCENYKDVTSARSRWWQAEIDRVCQPNAKLLRPKAKGRQTT